MSEQEAVLINGWYRLVSPSTKTAHLREFTNGLNGDVSIENYIAAGWEIEPAVVMMKAEYDAAPVPVAPAIPEIISALEFFVENFGSWNGNDNATYHTGVLSRMLAEMQAERGEG
jgi:hypothetical protein